MEDNAYDFTFCQVGPRTDEDILESPSIVPDIGKIDLSEKQVDGVDGSKVDATKNNTGVETTFPSTSSEPRDAGKKDASKTSNESTKSSQPINKKPVARAKVPFEKGYSPMDWMKLTRTHPDLAGLKGQSYRRLISLDEVKKHKTGDTIWTVLKGRVYNIAPYMKFHPGGVDMLMKASGKDCTSIFSIQLYHNIFSTSFCFFVIDIICSFLLSYNPMELNTTSFKLMPALVRIIKLVDDGIGYILVVRLITLFST